MLKRSLEASVDGIKKAQAALINRSLSQQQLAREVGISRQPVSNFFHGKPVERSIFIDICETLRLEWDEIVAVSSLPDADDAASICQIEGLVQEVREKIKPSILERYGRMRVLDMTQPIKVNDIYTNVNILEKIPGRRWLGIDELLQERKSEDFERFGLLRTTEKRVSGQEAVKRYSKLMVLGKPGAGKTMFLKYLAIQCIEGHFQGDVMARLRVPIFITLKDFAEAPEQADILQYIAEQLSVFGVTDATVKAQQLLRQGKALVLLDGLDEVPEKDTIRVLKQIRKLSDQFYINQFVITCRIAAKEYIFEHFTEVEVADFDSEQIAIFAENWFSLSDPVKAKRFIEKLQQNKPIQELATHPLFLTLLCLVFGEIANFPANRSELYKEGLDLLLKKWDVQRGIERDQVYKQFSLQRKQDLLEQIAWTTFLAGEYFFKQKAVEQHIANYIRNLPDANLNPEALQIDSEAILKSIETQHGLLVERARGIYSFSHITFHEYFTAKKIVSTPPEQVKKVFQNLVSHITEKRWREVFFLTVEMLQSADYLLQLMKREIDSLLPGNENNEKQLSDPQKKRLQQYDYAKKLLIDCLKSDCYVSRDVQQSIEDSLILAD
ncbi:NACHT domain-containing NTPase [Tolypothrix campylonemoides VB511288]|nr:NACHT domain-containing NTPase [Tolypothrix campylonemoides VB511288]